MEIIEMLTAYTFITVVGMDITVYDFIGFDDNWSEIMNPKYLALDDEEEDALYSLLEDLEAQGYSVHWTSEEV